MSWLVVGSGKTAQSVVLYLTKQKETVAVSDPNISDEIANDLAAAGAQIIKDAQDETLLEKFGFKNIVPSPGIPPSHALIAAAQKKRLNFFTDVDLALKGFAGDIIAVTGTNGKSTCVAMLAHIIDVLGKKRALACGNIGTPILTATNQDLDVLVVELSSYQLAYSQNIAAAACLFTSFSSDHLAWHNTIEHYFRSKWRLVEANASGTPLFSDQTFDDAAKKFGLAWPKKQPQLILADDSLTRRCKELCPNIVTEHDRKNAAACARVLVATFAASETACLQALKTFSTLPHRFEVFAKKNGYPIINDSKATNLEAVLLSLASLTAPATVLLGGQGKGESFDRIKGHRDMIKRIVTFGKDAQVIRDALPRDLVVASHATLKDALNSFAAEWFDGPVLLSPGCASFDEFANFEERGVMFQEAMRRFALDT